MILLLRFLYNCLLLFNSKYPLSALLTFLPLIPSITEEITGFTSKAVKGANKAPKIPPSCVLISCFTVSVTSSTNRPESSDSFMILIISFISSLEINKVYLFPALTANFSLIFVSNSFIAFQVKLLTNPGKLSLAKGISIFVSALLPKLHNQEPKDPPD